MVKQQIAIKPEMLDDEIIDVEIRTPTFFEQMRLAGMAPDVAGDPENVNVENEDEAEQAIDFTYEMLTTLTDLPDDTIESLSSATVGTLMDALNALMNEDDPLAVDGVYASEADTPDFMGSELSGETRHC